MAAIGHFFKAIGIVVVFLLTLPLMIVAQYKTDKLKDDGEMDDNSRPY